MTQEKIQRINELAKKSREEELTDTEKAEQKALREEYVAEIRASFQNTLEHTSIQTPDGQKHKLTRKDE